MSSMQMRRARSTILLSQRRYCSAYISAKGLWNWHLSIWRSGSRRHSRERMSVSTLLAYGECSMSGSSSTLSNNLSGRDTVSSVGVVRNKSLPLTDRTDHICFFCHALALDEHRVKFLPKYAHGGMLNLKPGQQKQDTSQPGKFRRSADFISDDNEVIDTKADVETPSPHPHIKEVWFPGTHSDMCMSPLLDLPCWPLCIVVGVMNSIWTWNFLALDVLWSYLKWPADVTNQGWLGLEESRGGQGVPDLGVAYIWVASL